MVVPFTFSSMRPSGKWMTVTSKEAWGGGRRWSGRGGVTLLALRSVSNDTLLTITGTALIFL